MLAKQEDEKELYNHFISHFYPIVLYGRLWDQWISAFKGIVTLHKQRDAIEYTMIMRFGVSFGREEAPKDSYLLTGRLPKGIRRGGENPGHMLCFKYKHKNEVLIKPKLFVSRTTDDISRISLVAIEDVTFQFYETNITSFFRYGERGRIPNTHIALLLKGDIADIYVICNKRELVSYLNVIISGCEVLEGFNDQRICIEHLLGLKNGN